MLRRYGWLTIPLAVLLAALFWLVHYEIVWAQAPQDLTLESVAVVAQPMGDDLAFEVRAPGPYLLVTLASHVDFEAYVHRHRFRAGYDTVSCTSGTHDPRYLSSATIFDRHGVVDAEARIYGRGTATGIESRPRPATSGPADASGIRLYRVYVPVRTGTSLDLRGHPEDVCVRFEDLEKFFPGYRTNVVTISKRTVAAAFSHPA